MTLLIYDCDGVLVDSEVLASEALAELVTSDDSSPSALAFQLHPRAREGDFGSSHPEELVY